MRQVRPSGRRADRPENGRKFHSDVDPPVAEAERVTRNAAAAARRTGSLHGVYDRVRVVCEMVHVTRNHTSRGSAEPEKKKRGLETPERYRGVGAW